MPSDDFYMQKNEEDMKKAKSDLKELENLVADLYEGAENPFSPGLGSEIEGAPEELNEKISDGAESMNEAYDKMVTGSSNEVARAAARGLEHYRDAVETALEDADRDQIAEYMTFNMMKKEAEREDGAFTEEEIKFELAGYDRTDNVSELEIDDPPLKKRVSGNVEGYAREKPEAAVQAVRNELEEMLGSAKRSVDRELGG
ncbi:MAG: hypothetical protein ABEJ72_11275 [Candidatus Aenigmatarchaeota archaeon]